MGVKLLNRSLFSVAMFCNGAPLVAEMLGFRQGAIGFFSHLNRVMPFAASKNMMVHNALCGGLSGAGVHGCYEAALWQTSHLGGCMQQSNYSK